MSTLLKLEDITMQFGGVVAVNNLSLEVASKLGEGSTFTVGFENCLVKNSRHGH